MFATIERVIRRDPARRGLASLRVGGEWLCAGQFELAAESLARRARRVAIVTGFPVVTDSVTIETDGPPGAVYLAQALLAVGIDVVLVSDPLGVPVLRCAAGERNLDVSVAEFPFEWAESLEIPRAMKGATTCAHSDSWTTEFLDTETQRGLTHLVAIERPGPSQSQGECLNLRGESIDGYVGKTHRLFEQIAEHGLEIVTVGICDGGNEIGCGAIPWESLPPVETTAIRRQTACRVATDHLILAGVSNWGAYGLAVALLHRRKHIDAMRSWDVENERQLIEHLVAETGIVDGITGLAEATVDGLPLETYLQGLAGVRRAVGLDP